MEDIIDQTLDDEYIRSFAATHEDSKKEGGEAEIRARFQYAYALIRSKHNQDVNHGLNLLENLYYEDNPSSKRDYLYYIAIGQTRLKRYDLALEAVNHFLQFEPENRQAAQLKSFIKKKLTKDGIIGMAITGGAALVIGGLIGLGLSLSKK